MSEPFVGEIRIFAGNFAPSGWALCDGQLLAVSQNDALFSLLGTIYGGDGRTTFALPDMRGRLVVHAGHGPGLSDRRLGAKFGAEAASLTPDTMAVHNHSMMASSQAADSDNAGGNVLANTGLTASYNTAVPDVQMAGETSSFGGSGQPHTNLMPALCVNYIIALFGIYPSRS